MYSYLCIENKIITFISNKIICIPNFNYVFLFLNIFNTETFNGVSYLFLAKKGYFSKGVHFPISCLCYIIGISLNKNYVNCINILIIEICVDNRLEYSIDRYSYFDIRNNKYLNVFIIISSDF